MAKLAGKGSLNIITVMQLATPVILYYTCHIKEKDDALFKSAQAGNPL
jgi:hypothetical protein